MRSKITELGQILFNLVNIVPDGLVVFFPSYSFLFTLRSHWKESGLLDRIGQKKTVVVLHSHFHSQLNQLIGFLRAK
jgi:Rad3-related DNA helicase